MHSPSHPRSRTPLPLARSAVGALVAAGFVLAGTLAGCSVGGTSPSDDQPTTSSDEPLTANTKAAYDFFVNKGLSNVQSAAIVGNLMQESGVNSTIKQFGGGPGRGIAQWSAGGRWDHDGGDNAVAFAQAQSESVWSLNLQLEFVWFELKQFPGYGLAQLEASTNISNATVVFQDKFEGCGTCAQSTRVKYAKQVLAAYGNSTPPPPPPPPPPAMGCTSDADCNNGAQGTGQVCGQNGHCIMGCHIDTDCPSGDFCDASSNPPKCAMSSPPPPPPSNCPVLTYPSGIKIQTVTDDATTGSYANHLASGQSAPTCFLDVNNLHNPDTNETYTIDVHVAANFQLSELVGTEVAQGWGHFVLMNPEAVASLQAFRGSIGGPVSVNSGYRSPKHQESVCNSLCGNPLGCPGTCANNSRHMWGDAFDLPTTFYNTTDTGLACDAGFKFTYLESGTHLHIDQNPAYATCVQQ